jgi:hypothetical protein
VSLVLRSMVKATGYVCVRKTAQSVDEIFDQLITEEPAVRLRRLDWSGRNGEGHPKRIVSYKIVGTYLRREIGSCGRMDAA